MNQSTLKKNPNLSPELIGNEGSENILRPAFLQDFLGQNKIKENLQIFLNAAKKRGDNLGYNGHKHTKGDKVVPFCDRNCNVISPFVTAPGNRNETILLTPAISNLKKIVRLIGIDLKESIMSLDGIYNSHKNRKAIFNLGMTPNIPENKRNRKRSKRGRKQTFCQKIFKERFRTIERIFAWEDKFKRLLLRFEFHSINHYAMKTIAYSMINLRHFCG